MTRELDAKVAEALGYVRVSVWRWSAPVDGDVWYWRLVDLEMMRILIEREEWRPYQDGDTREVGDTWCVGVKRYSTDWAAAGPLFEKLGPGWKLAQADVMGWAPEYRWWCIPVVGDTMMAPIAPEAICRAFLKAVGGVPGSELHE